MVEYNKANVKLLDSQLNRLKTAVKSQTGVTSRTNIKMFNGNNLPHEFTTFTTSLTDIMLSRAQISKIIQYGRFLGSLLSKTAYSLIKVAVPLARNILPPLGIIASASEIDAGIPKNTKHGSGSQNC